MQILEHQIQFILQAFAQQATIVRKEHLETQLLQVQHMIVQLATSAWLEPVQQHNAQQAHITT